MKLREVQTGEKTFKVEVKDFLFWGTHHLYYTEEEAIDECKKLEEKSRLYPRVVYEPTKETNE